MLWRHFVIIFSCVLSGMHLFHHSGTSFLVVDADQSVDGGSSFHGAAADCSGTPGSCLNNRNDDDATAGLMWLGGEPNLLTVQEEAAGVMEVLNLLTEEEQNQVVKSDTTLPIRYFRRAKGNATNAAFFLRKTLEWRRDFRVDDIINCRQQDAEGSSDLDICKQIVQEHETGRFYVRSHDIDGRAIICGHLGVRNTGDETAQLRTLIYTLEKAFACTARKSTEIGGRPLEKVIMVLDFDGYSRKNSYSFGTLKKVNEIMSYQYPERLTAVFMINPPLFLSVVWKMIRPFIDPKTSKKYHFCSNEKELKQLTSRVRDLGKLEVPFGGTDPNLRPFDAGEYLRLPFDESFDEHLEF